MVVLPQCLRSHVRAHGNCIPAVTHLTSLALTAAALASSTDFRTPPGKYSLRSASTTLQSKGHGVREAAGGRLIALHFICNSNMALLLQNIY
jgi:hypothetical protein